MPAVAVCQFNSTTDLSSNFEQLQRLLVDCQAIEDLSLVVLPEGFACLAPDAQSQYTESLTPAGKFIQYCLDWSVQSKADIILGGINVINNANQKPFNTAIYIRNGKVVDSYQKMHLFDAILPSGNELKESLNIQAGNQPCVIESNIGKIGMSICYDIRFPELYTYYANANTTAICVPAAFTQATGELHWEVLLRARAIETQCYIFAAAQTGHHYGERYSYGHAMIIDPLGRILALKEEGIGVISANIDSELIQKTRHNMPIKHHRHAFFN